MNREAVISEIIPGSIAERAGLSIGDKVLKINNKKLQDILDYQLLVDQSRLSFTVERKGKEEYIEIAKAYGQSPGIKFTSSVFDHIKTCCNDCIFCFVNQLPSGVRSELLLKDDDYRLSFLYGNFITLTNLSEAELSRIIKLRLSPLYVSLHSTEPNVRKILFGNKKDRALSFLKKLLENGIKIHAQIVLCPGINDGNHLWATLIDLASRFSDISSVGIVPVGLTKFQNKNQLRLYSSNEMKKIVIEIERNKKAKLGDDFSQKVIIADEFYLKSNMVIPETDRYLDYCQLENGIGMTRMFINNLRSDGKGLVLKSDIGIITAKLFYPVLKKELNKIFKNNSKLKIYMVENRFFGPSVSVNGLLAGNDIISSLEGKNIPEYIFMSKVLLSAGSFIDGLSADDLEKALKKKIIYLDHYGQDFQKKIMEVAV